jgi:hypothetical protein
VAFALLYRGERAPGPGPFRLTRLERSPLRANRRIIGSDTVVGAVCDAVKKAEISSSAKMAATVRGCEFPGK